MHTKVSSNGRIVIRLGIEEGTRVWIELNEDDKQIILKPITVDYVHSLRGRFRGIGLMEALMAEKKREGDD